jgi:sugar phosphate isomerase/epimerase
MDATVENCRKVIDAVKPKRAKFTLEMMPWAIPDGPDNNLQLIKAVDRPAFGVHVDVCNMVNTADRFLRNAVLIEDCFKKLGKWIVSCHAKDLKGEKVESADPALFKAGWKLRPVVETVPGRGTMDYRAYLRAIADYAPGAPLLLEHLSTAKEYDEGRNYIVRVATSVGLSFS